jgi:hypothetical protein
MARDIIRSVYHVIYDAARSDMREWSRKALGERLGKQLARGDGGDEVWATIDAMTDLLGGIAPPDPNIPSI